MKDIFDVEFEEDLQDMYKMKLWSEVDDELKDRMVEHLKNNLIGTL